MPIVVRNWIFFRFFRKLNQFQNTSTKLPRRSEVIPTRFYAPPEASSKFCEHFRQNSKIRENLHFRVHAPDLSFRTIFFLTHKQTWDPHRWIGLDLVQVGKLLRTQTNSRIPRYRHFRNMSRTFPDILNTPNMVYAPRKLPQSSRTFSTKLKNCENFHFRHHAPDLCFRTTFSKTHKQTGAHITG